VRALKAQDLEPNAIAKHLGIGRASWPVIDYAAMLPSCGRHCV
jgi:hypothetical protein